MLRTHTCGELRLSDVGKTVKLAGWVQRSRDKGSVLWIDLRDRYGITQLIFEEGKTDPTLFAEARATGREFVIQVEGLVAERLSKNDKINTGEVEISQITALYY
jgi:aspartyl-tRNA synthetase